MSNTNDVSQLRERIEKLEADNRYLAAKKSATPKYNRFVFWEAPSGLCAGGILNVVGKNVTVERHWPTPMVVEQIQNSQMKSISDLDALITNLRLVVSNQRARIESLVFASASIERKLNSALKIKRILIKWLGKL